MTTPEEARYLAQRSAAWQIRDLFGEKHCYINDNGNCGLNQPILDEFKRIRPMDVVWSRRRQVWRKRQASDPQTGIMVR
jgi:hypothetical protein